MYGGDLRGERGDDAEGNAARRRGCSPSARAAAPAPAGTATAAASATATATASVGWRGDGRV